MKLENVRGLSENENDALYWALTYASQNPTAAGLDKEEGENAGELLKLFKHGQFRISEEMSIIK